MAEKKRQHYVPKVYLKYFSLDDKSINIFNIETGKLYTNIPFKSQFKDSYYYGSNLKVENTLGFYESNFDEAFIKIEKNLELSRDEKIIIMKFALLQKHRTNKNIKPIEDMVKKKAETQLRSMHPNAGESTNEIFDKCWKEKYGNVKEMEYEIAIDTISDLFKNEELAKYNAIALKNNSGIDFLSSDNPVCVIDIDEGKLTETSCLAPRKIMFFPLGFKKLIVIYGKEEYEIVKKSLNKQDVLTVNTLIALNADKQLITPSSFSENKIKHWITKINAKVVDDGAQPLVRNGPNILYKFTPKYVEYKNMPEFIRKK